MADRPTPAPHREADLALIKDIIPHRYPFLMIDRVERIEPYVSAVGIKMVTCNEPHFEGHFPQKPIMPGVLVIEAMAQASAVLVGISMDIIGKDLLTYFMGIDKAKFRRMVVPGDRLELHVTATRAGGKIWKFTGIAKVGDEVAAEADFTAMMDLRG